MIHIVFASSSTQYVVNYESAKTIVTNIRDTIEDTLGFKITYIADDFYGIDPDETLNRILISLACIVLFAIIAVAVGLHMRNKRKELAAKKQKVKER